MTRHARRGFTLLELILAAGIVAILMLSLYTALHTAYKARAAMNTASARVRTARIALDLIEQNLKSALPPNARTTATAVLAGPFQGTQNEIDLYCLAHDYGNDTDPLSDGMRYVTIMMDSSTATTAVNGQALVQKVTRNLLPAAPVDPVEETLATNVTAFTVRYYDGVNWADTWDSTQQNNALPVAVEVTVTVQPSAKDQPYTLMRTIALPCGVNINNQTSTDTATTTQ